MGLSLNIFLILFYFFVLFCLIVVRFCLWRIFSCWCVRVCFLFVFFWVWFVVGGDLNLFIQCRI